MMFCRKAIINLTDGVLMRKSFNNLGNCCILTMNGTIHSINRLHGALALDFPTFLSKTKEPKQTQQLSGHPAHSGNILTTLTPELFDGTVQVVL